MPHIYNIPFLNPDYFFTLFESPTIELTEDDIFEADWLDVFVGMLAEAALSDNPNQTKEATEKEIEWFLDHVKNKHLKVNSEPTSGSVPIQQARIIEVERGLKTLYKILRDEVSNVNPSEEDQLKQKKLKENRSLTYYDLKEQVDQCAIGFHNRVVKCINKFKCPTNLLEILTQYRESLLAEVQVRINKELPAMLLRRGNPKPAVDQAIAELKEEGIHLDRIIHTIAHPIVGTMIINASDYIGLPIENDDVRYFLRRIFQEKYQLFSTINGALEEIKTFLINQGCYNGFNNTELGYRELDYGQMIKLISKILEMEPTTDILQVDESSAIRDLNKETMLQLIFEKMLDKQLFNLDTETEKLFNLMANFFRARATHLDDEPLTLKSYISNPIRVNDWDYKSTLQRIKILAPLPSNGLKSMIDFLEFFCPYLVVGDVNDFMEAFSPDFFVDSAQELVENFSNYSPILQGLLISYLPETYSVAEAQNEDEDVITFRPNFLQFAIQYLPIEKIDLVMNKMVTLPFFYKRQILTYLTPAGLNHLIEEKDGTEAWRFYLLEFLNKIVEYKNDDYDFSTSEKQKIYIELWDKMDSLYRNSLIHSKIKNAIYGLFSIKTSMDFYLKKKASMQIIASHLTESEKEKFLAIQNEVLEKSSNLSSESLSELVSLLDEEEKASISKAEFNNQLHHFVNEAPCFFWNWMASEPVSGTVATRLRNVLGNFPVIINPKLSAENIIYIFQHTTYIFYAIIFNKICHEIIHSDTEILRRFIQVLKNIDTISPEREVLINSKASLTEYRAKSKKFVSYFLINIMYNLYEALFAKSTIDTMGDNIKLLDPARFYNFITKLISNNEKFLSQIIVNKEDFFKILNQFAPFEGLNLYFMMALTKKIPLLMSDIKDIYLLSHYFNNMTLSIIVESLINNEKSLFFNKNKDNKEDIIKLYWIYSLLEDTILPIDEVIDNLPLYQWSFIGKNIDEFLHENEKFISIFKSIPQEYKKYLLNVYWDSIKEHIINTELDDALFHADDEGIKKIIFEKIVGDDTIALTGRQYCRVLKLFPSIDRRDEIENSLFEFFISQEKLKIETKVEFESVFVELSNHNATKLIKKQDAAFFNSAYKESDFVAEINFFSSSSEQILLFLEKITSLLKTRKFEYDIFKETISILNKKAPLALSFFIESIEKNNVNEMAKNNFYQFSEIINILDPVESSFSSLLDNISNDNLKLLLDCYLIRPPHEIQSKKLEIIIALKKYTTKNLFSMGFSELRLRNLFSSLIKEINFENIIRDIDDIQLIENVLLENNKFDFFNNENFNDSPRIVDLFLDYSEFQARKKQQFSHDNNIDVDFSSYKTNAMVDSFFDDEYSNNISFFDNIVGIDNALELSEEALLYNLANEFLFYSTGENDNNRSRRTKLESARLFSTCVDNIPLKNAAKEISAWPRCPANTKMSDYYNFILTKVTNLGYEADSDFADLVYQAKKGAEKFAGNLNNHQNADTKVFP